MQFAPPANGPPLLRIRDLRVSFRKRGQALEALRGIDLDVGRSEVLGIVGESGSGKSIGMLAALGLAPPNAVVSGSVQYFGDELLTKSRRQMRNIRGAKIAMIFQDPLSSLNPTMRVGDQIIEALQLHQPRLSAKQATQKALELLELVSIPQPDQRLRQFPHEFSGGMRQRVMIAMAVANGPDLLIADEPTTALDVTVQSQIMGMLRQLQAKLGLGLVLITHDLGVLAGHANRVAVIYAGQVVEQADVFELFQNPRHPYTRGLISSIPKLTQSGGRLFSIAGSPPPLGQFPAGCAFHPRCDHAGEICRQVPPPTVVVGRPDHSSACHFANVLAEWGGVGARVKE
ncbi:ABC transporter ATP-binding protein [Mesorhizobium sp. B3-1-3]|uniref:ABC transporter ATP-binding protein n=1 Tax=unclassified Mesorhizobium TaxID=325217 RepID=UPI00112A7426|nr:MULTISPECIES: ABC transporter ATP-binding protein [unclassified Mesorhizobium]TPI61538.1 ABC transporter ATP-binding protein [Mesorhizobium sp. B3-1-8]TPI70598.1 ABC transporter ATP-binding protein [Mesorhizobium sp. B3-1-3]